MRRSALDGGAYWAVHVGEAGAARGIGLVASTRPLRGRRDKTSLVRAVSHIRSASVPPGVLQLGSGSLLSLSRN